MNKQLILYSAGLLAALNVALTSPNKDETAIVDAGLFRTRIHIGSLTNSFSCSSSPIHLLFLFINCVPGD